MTQNTTKLAKQQRARLCTEFVIPLVAVDMIEGHEALDDVAVFTLHDMIGELAPDAALLCMALTAQQMIACLPEITAAAPLKMEADKLVDEYAGLWLAHKDSHQPLKDQAVAEQLAYLPEDLEALGDLCAALQTPFARHNQTALTLCNILSVQAHAHSAAAADCLEEARLPKLSRASVTATDNVVVFPGAFRPL